MLRLAACGNKVPTHATGLMAVHPDGHQLFAGWHVFSLLRDLMVGKGGCARRGQGGGDVYVALNAHGFEVQAGLPAPQDGCKWARLVGPPPPPPFSPLTC